MIYLNSKMYCAAVRKLSGAVYGPNPCRSYESCNKHSGQTQVTRKSEPSYFRKTPICTAIITGLLATPVIAEEGDFYIGIGGGLSYLTPETNNTNFQVDEDEDSGFKVFLGYDASNSITIEGYYAVLGAAELSGSSLPGGTFLSDEIDYKAYGINGLLYLPDNLPGFKAFLKLGAGGTDNDSDTIPYTQSDSVQLTGGAGLEWAARSGFGIRADYNFLGEDAQFVALNLLKRFGESEPEPVKLKDSDGDGVYDPSDQCLNSPPGVRVDVYGCRIQVKPKPVDLDKDGVLNFADKCPGTPAGVPVMKDGCPLDSDSDGVIDAADNCPNTPRGHQVNRLGCSLDSDGDGVVDGSDQCPNTSPGVTVDANGCKYVEVVPEPPPPPPPVEVERFSGILHGVNFYTNSAELTQEARFKLDGLAEQLLQYPDARIIVVGHTDSEGSEESNVTLSRNRARAVANYLVSRGLIASQMRYTGKGEAEPVASNDTPEGRAENRRVELVVR